MEFIKQHYKKIIIVLFCILFLNFCVKNCSKSNELRQSQLKLDSCEYVITTYTDSIVKLNNMLNNKDIELESKNEQINQLNKTITTVVNKNSINHIKVIVPETEKTYNKNE